MTECSAEPFEFHALGKRKVIGKFDGGAISSDGGGLLLGEVEAKTRIIERLAEQFIDYRDPGAIEHSVKALVGQRVFGLALGYEDLNDLDRLRLDPLLAVLVGKLDPTGQDRVLERDCGKPLASSSTLNRLELTPWYASADERYHKIVAKPSGIDRLLVDCFLEAPPEPPSRIWLDLDATDDSAARPPGGVLLPRLLPPLRLSATLHLRRRAARGYVKRTSMRRSRRVVAKAEHLSKGANPRFVVTSLPAERFEARTLYEQHYCARGDNGESNQRATVGLVCRSY